MPFFRAHVRYEGELHGWEPAGRALVDITDDRTDDWLKPPPGEPPVAAFMVVSPHTIERLGGVRAAVGALGAIDAAQVHGDPSRGVAIQLARRPDDITDDRLAELRAYFGTENRRAGQAIRPPPMVKVSPWQ